MMRHFRDAARFPNDDDKDLINVQFSIPNSQSGEASQMVFPWIENWELNIDQIFSPNKKAATVTELIS